MELKQLGPYVLKRQIGQGGMGTVYEGEHVETGEIVAIKSLVTSRSSDAKFRKRFESEINTLIELNHPNIVRILSHGQDQGHLYFAMQLVEGESLYDRLKERGPLSWAEAVGYTLDICEGLRHAHDRGFIHRDLKPSNLLLDPNGRVLITDFGIARDSAVLRPIYEDQMTAPGGIVGTLDFMSPEQIQGETATIRSDIYSLGCVLYALLSGRPPFSFRSIGDAQTTIRHTPATRIGLLVPKLPTALERIIMRMLEVDPAKRHGTALAVSKRLNEFLEERSLAQNIEQNLEVLDEEASDYQLQGEPGVHVQKTEMSNPKEDGRTTLASGNQPSVAEPSNPAEATQQNRPTLTAHDDAWGAQPKEDYFSKVARDESSLRSWDLPTDTGGPVWPYVIGLSTLLVLLLGALLWALTLQHSADQIYSKISSAIEAGDNPTVIEDELRIFIERFPEDPRVGDAQQQLDAIAARRLPRKLNRLLQFGGTGQLNDAEREFLRALRISETDPAEALHLMAAVAEVYQDSTDKDTRQCVEAALQQSDWLTTIVEQQTEERKRTIQAALESFAADPSPSSASIQAKCEGLLLLYGQDPVLQEALQPVREQLKSLQSSE
jgi:serine/threonine protein kinase